MTRSFKYVVPLVVVSFTFFFVFSIQASQKSVGKPVAASAPQPELKWKVVSSGGTNATSGGLRLQGTIGQTSTTFSTAGSLNLNAGFWQNFGSGACCVGIRGDFNGDGLDNSVLDLTYLIDDIFRGGPPSACPEEADINSDLTPSTVLDLTFIINDIFRGGPSPASCP